MFLTYDITSTLSWLMTQSLRAAGFGISLLDSFTFFGFSLLDFILCLGVLGVLISIVIPHLDSSGEVAKFNNRFW